MYFYGDDRVNESDLYKKLGTLTKDRERWETSIPYVSSLFAHDSVKIQAKALWLLGEMGLAYPLSVQDVVQDIASFCSSPVSLLRERAVNALGRIGRGKYGCSIDLLIELSFTLNASSDYLLLGRNPDRDQDRKQLLQVISQLSDIARNM